MKTKQTFTPFGPRHLVRPDSPETTTASGLVVPAQHAKNKVLVTGTIIASGTGAARQSAATFVEEPMRAKVGDRVLVSRLETTTIELDGVEHLIVEDECVFGKYEGGA